MVFLQVFFGTITLICFLFVVLSVILGVRAGRSPFGVVKDKSFGGLAISLLLSLIVLIVHMKL